MNTGHKLITVLGPTAAGKTGLAARLAHAVAGEVISADSRQVFRRMDLGTGKDLGDYLVDGTLVAVHLVDIAEAGTEYSVYRFLHDFEDAYNSIVSAGRQPVMCGGTGLYLEAVLNSYSMPLVPENMALRGRLSQMDSGELIEMLTQYKNLHNTTDTSERERLLRAIEIEEFKRTNPGGTALPDFSNSPVFGLRYQRAASRERITARLRQRISEGLIDEVKQLLSEGIPAERLIRYGLEYKYVTHYIEGKIRYDEMFTLLNTAIHQFAKRQMTWFRRMEARGTHIHWLEGEAGPGSNLEEALEVLAAKTA